MNDFLLHFERQSKRSILIKAYLTVAVVTLVDYGLGTRLSLFIVYFFPTLIVAWYAGRRAGIVIASVCAAAVFIQDLSDVHSLVVRGVDDLIPYWDFLQHLVLFVTFGLTVSSLRRWQDEKVERDFKVAREVQSFMLPRSLPAMKTLEYRGVFKPATTLSGDFYDCLPVAPGKLALVIGDVCGKGTPAALLMAYLHGVLKSHATTGGEDPGSLMATTNRSLYSSSGSDKFASLFYGVYEDAARTLTYVNAGHDAPIVVREGGDGGASIARLETEGLLLGVLPDAVYAPKTIELLPGDTLVLFTDGVADARNAVGECFDEGRLSDLLLGNRRLPPDELAAAVMREVEAFIGAEQQFDDITLVVARVR